MFFFLFLQKNYWTLKLQPNSRSTKKTLRIADWTNDLRDTLTQSGGTPNGRSLALLARGSEINALHLHNLRPCVIVVCFLKKKYCTLKILNRSRLSATKNLIVADWEWDLRDRSYQRGCSSNGKALPSNARGTGINAQYLQNLGHFVSVFLFLQKNYCTLKLQPNRRSTKKKLRIADWTNYLRYTLAQRGGIANGRSLVLLARDSEMKALHLHNLRPCVIVVCFLEKKYCILKLLSRSRLSAKTS